MKYVNVKLRRPTQRKYAFIIERELNKRLDADVKFQREVKRLYSKAADMLLTGTETNKQKGTH